MKRLSDSTHLLGDGPALRDRLWNDGYLFLRGLFENRAVTALAADMLEIAADHGWTTPGSDPLERRPSADPLIEGAEGWWPVYHRIQELESFHKLAHSAAAIGLMETLSDGPVIVHPRKIARLNYPAPERTTTPFHQDLPLIGGTVDFLTLWSPLCDLAGDEGGLGVIPGSHLKGIRKVNLDRGKEAAAFAWVDVDDNERRHWSTIDFRAGDALIFHSLVVHAGIPNQSDRIRVSVDYRYQPADEAVSALSLAPHYYESGLDTPDWSEFTHGWTDRSGIAVPEGVKVVPAEMTAFTGNIGPNIGSQAGRSRYVDASAFARQVGQTHQLWPAANMQAGDGAKL